MGWLIALGILVLIASIPLGVEACYDEIGFLAKVIIGPVRLTVFPRPKKKKKAERPKDTPPAPEKRPEPRKAPAPAAAPKEKPTGEPMEKKGGSLLDFLPLVKLGLDLLGDFRRKLRVNRLVLWLTMAADDPCDLAVNYGRAWAAVGNLIPQLERLFVIKKRAVEVRCDFTASETLIFVQLDMTITLGRILALAAVYGFRALKEILSIRKKRKGGAVK